jgi:AcrR family transcriptional regulator
MTRIQDVTSARNRIIKAASVLFSKQGYYRTGTRDIARLADVSEVTIFRYFETKEEIFLAALESCYKPLETRLDPFRRTITGQHPQEALPRIVQLLIDIAVFSPELPQLIAVAALEVRGKYQAICRKMLLPLLSSIAEYLTINMRNEVLRELEPSIVTAAMALTIIAHPKLSQVIAGCELSTMDSRTTLQEFTDFWMKVLIAPATPALPLQS